jgi:phospholipid/cholesterol/gamma-HCH transport system substrate-binding protein
MKEQAKNMMIGLFVVAACVIIVWLLMFLNPSVGDSGTKLIARFADIDKITVGTRVTFAGRPVGEVVNIQEIEGARTENLGTLGDVYIYELELVVDSSVHVYDTDEVSVRTSGLLGEKSIAIIPRRPEPGRTPLLVNDRILYATPTGSVEEALGKLDTLSDKAGKALDEVIGLIDDNDEAFGEAIKEANEALKQFNRALTHVNDVRLVDNINQTTTTIDDTVSHVKRELELIDERNMINEFSDVVQNVNEITNAINEPETLNRIVRSIDTLLVDVNQLQEKVNRSWDRIDHALDDLASAASNARLFTEDGREAIGKVNEIVDYVYDGKGSVGLLLRSDDFYLRMANIMNKANILMNDINHYGLLFHNDKRWQRERMAKANQIAKINSPNEFKQYFEGEIDNISASFERVDMLLMRAEEVNQRKRFLDDHQFDKSFADLLRRVDTLQGNLKLYTDNVIEER